MAGSRIVVIGIANATFEAIEPWVKAGKLPTLARLFADGTHARICGAAPHLAADAVGRLCEVAGAHGKRVTVVRPPASTPDVVRSLDESASDLLWIGFPPAEREDASPSETLRAYRGIDACLADVVSRLDERTHLLVVSEHVTTERTLSGLGGEVYAFVRALRRSGLGWLPRLLQGRNSTTRQPERLKTDVVPVSADVQTAGRRNGIVVLVGPAARGGADVSDLDVADVGPTVLHLLGVPLPADMRDAIARGVLAAADSPARTDGGRRAPADVGTSEGVGYP
jgi:hypothetical protein